MYLDPAQRSIVDGSVAGADPRLPQQRRLKQKTQCDYGRLLNVFAPIGHHPADSVRRRHIRELSKTFACEARTQQLFGQVASLLFNFGVGNDYVETNPALRMKCMDRPRA